MGTIQSKIWVGSLLAFPSLSTSIWSENGITLSSLSTVDPIPSIELVNGVAAYVRDENSIWIVGGSPPMEQLFEIDGGSLVVSGSSRLLSPPGSPSVSNPVIIGAVTLGFPVSAVLWKDGNNHFISVRYTDSFIRSTLIESGGTAVSDNPLDIAAVMTNSDSYIITAWGDLSLTTASIRIYQVEAPTTNLLFIQRIVFAFNESNPKLTSLENGRFAVCWIRVEDLGTDLINKSICQVISINGLNQQNEEIDLGSVGDEAHSLAALKNDKIVHCAVEFGQVNIQCYILDVDLNICANFKLFDTDTPIIGNPHVFPVGDYFVVSGDGIPEGAGDPVGTSQMFFFDTTVNCQAQSIYPVQRLGNPWIRSVPVTAISTLVGIPLNNYGRFMMVFGDSRPNNPSSDMTATVYNLNTPMTWDDDTNNVCLNTIGDQVPLQSIVVSDPVSLSEVQSDPNHVWFFGREDSITGSVNGFQYEIESRTSTGTILTNVDFNPVLVSFPIKLQTPGFGIALAWTSQSNLSFLYLSKPEISDTSGVTNILIGSTNLALSDVTSVIKPDGTEHLVFSSKTPRTIRVYDLNAGIFNTALIFPSFFSELKLASLKDGKFVACARPSPSSTQCYLIDIGQVQELPTSPPSKLFPQPSGFHNVESLFNDKFIVCVEQSSPQACVIADRDLNKCAEFDHGLSSLSLELPLDFIYTIGEYFVISSYSGDSQMFYFDTSIQCDDSTMHPVTVIGDTWTDSTSLNNLGGTSLNGRGMFIGNSLFSDSGTTKARSQWYQLMSYQKYFERMRKADAVLRADSKQDPIAQLSLKMTMFDSSIPDPSMWFSNPDPILFDAGSYYDVQSNREFFAIATANDCDECSTIDVIETDSLTSQSKKLGLYGQPTVHTFPTFRAFIVCYHPSQCYEFDVSTEFNLQPSGDDVLGDGGSDSGSGDGSGDGSDGGSDGGSQTTPEPPSASPTERPTVSPTDRPTSVGSTGTKPLSESCLSGDECISGLCGPGFITNSNGNQSFRQRICVPCLWDNQGCTQAADCCGGNCCSGICSASTCS